MMVIDGLQSAGTSDTAPSCDYDKDLTDGDFPVLYYNPGSMAEEFSSEGDICYSIYPGIFIPSE